MHLLIPHASALSEAGRHALRELRLPNLAALLAALAPAARDEADEFTLDAPHERALAALFGWQAPAGELPWGAHLAERDGIDPGTQAWGLLTPAHWHVGTDQVSLLPPEALALDEAASRELFALVAPLFESEGWALHWGAPLRWYAAHESLAGLPTASLDRVIGRNVDTWLSDHPQVRLIRRLQAEMQMTLYVHPSSDRRAEAGLLPVNSFWLSGCGRHQPARPAADLVVDERLRAPLLQDDWAGWAEAWAALDAGPLADARAALSRGEAVALTLCGERAAQRFEPQSRGLLARLAGRFRTVEPADVLLGL
ncbi:hypothetical protein [Caldimonas tepidiphila]|uniref:hypothetical protein n=1 Tax=Caldimonas tepidiphila TaxID=2315841 RepID=UPI000E5C4B23|nr:hypothetical protein [Caldimonas tepidiphila]